MSGFLDRLVSDDLQPPNAIAPTIGHRFNRNPDLDLERESSLPDRSPEQVRAPEMQVRVSEMKDHVAAPTTAAAPLERPERQGVIESQPSIVSRPTGEGEHQINHPAGTRNARTEALSTVEVAQSPPSASAASRRLGPPAQVATVDSPVRQEDAALALPEPTHERSGRHLDLPAVSGPVDSVARPHSLVAVEVDVDVANVAPARTGDRRKTEQAPAPASARRDEVSGETPRLVTEGDLVNAPRLELPVRANGPAARRQRRQPDVVVTIGQIEVVAPAAKSTDPPRTQSRRKARPRRVLALDEYLSTRRGAS